MTPGGDNVIAVMVSNAAVSDVAPLDADFTFFGGLYRDAHVLITDPLHVDALDFAASGVYVRASSVSATNATLVGRRAGAQRHEHHAETVGRRRRGRARGRNDRRPHVGERAAVAAGASTLLSSTAAFPSPHLWNGVADPYLYTVYAEISVGRNRHRRRVGPVRVPVLFRRRGAGLLAQRPVRGSARRQPPSGSAQHGLGDHGRAARRGHGAEIREMGATVVRLSHYEHAEYFSRSRAITTGIVLWAEIPLVNEITRTPPRSSTTPSSR